MHKNAINRLATKPGRQLIQPICYFDGIVDFDRSDVKTVISQKPLKCVSSEFAAQIQDPGS